MTRCPYRAELPPPALPDGTAVKIVGLGGVGSILARYGAVFLAALGTPLRLVLVDGDAFEDSNAARQLFDRVGNKAEVVRDELVARLGGSRLGISAVPAYVAPDNVGNIVQSGDVVLAAVDNHATRLLLTEHCATLDDVMLLSGGNDGVGRAEDGTSQRGTLGSVQVQIRRAGVELAPPLTRYHPDIADPSDNRPDEVDCLTAMQSQPQLLFTNMMTASCVLNTFALAISGDALHYTELSFDVADGVMRPVLP